MHTGKLLFRKCFFVFPFRCHMLVLFLLNPMLLRMISWLRLPLLEVESDSSRLSSSSRPRCLSEATMETSFTKSLPQNFSDTVLLFLAFHCAPSFSIGRVPQHLSQIVLNKNNFSLASSYFRDFASRIIVFGCGWREDVLDYIVVTSTSAHKSVSRKCSKI